MTSIFPNKTKSYNQAAWQKGYESQRQELAYEVTDIDGEIPVELMGTLFRNGPGLLDIGGMPIKHPFDGDGMVCSVSFQEGRAYFQNRFVQTAGFVAEQKAGQPIYRGVFGTQKPGGIFNNMFDLRLKNIANTNVIYWGKKLLALWEAAEPHSLNPENLETRGLDYLGETLKPGDSFSAHPRIDPASIWDGGEPCLVNFAVKPGLPTRLVIYEISPAGKLLRYREHEAKGFAFIHDFVITPNYVIFFQASVKFNPLPYVLGFKGAGECVKFEADKPTQMIVIPRDPARDDVQTLEAEAGFVFHHANAFEQDKRIIVDSVCYQSIPQVQADVDYKNVDFETLDPGQLWRFTLDLETKKVTRELLATRCCEFPVVHPERVGRDYRYAYIGATHAKTGNAPLQAVWKVDHQGEDSQVYSFAPDGFTGEPIFVPRPGATAEDEGWVLLMVYDSAQHRSDVVIFDAQNFAQPLATLHLKQHIPYGLHGSWTPEVFVNF
ncbi:MULTISPECIES: carotenoid oxygenase family protein [Cyanophyceae]|uniref:carotenoid oxygenase family protein n=1 Tax=Cyanophyceae TaxID=3028117 RepID=UPI00016DCC0A|nr:MULTISPECIES: carotenoid oxygenase family protein [Cyanophyceae]ACA99416.1 lignostilbene-alpha,beta-dioxygenase [Picosynechococcus sp. PCC 7002]SMH31367.1 all-trans-8'-apo-beta-carotenal 15,15'-oxygenase [Picosynechococcus sp. OG1]SMQ84044.1 all-trans-8'-apo-beta-carotenal 15,15'-oxygenase [Synechococcus sp. 7002]